MARYRTSRRDAAGVGCATPASSGADVAPATHTLNVRVDVEPATAILKALQTARDELAELDGCRVTESAERAYPCRPQSYVYQGKAALRQLDAAIADLRLSLS